MTADPSALQAYGILNQFRRILHANTQVMEKISELEQMMGGEFIFDQAFLQNSVKSLIYLVRQIINNLNILSDQQYTDLWKPFTRISNRITDIVSGGPGTYDEFLVLPLRLIHRDLDYLVGSRMSLLAEVRNELNIPVPNGFAITRNGFRLFLNQDDAWERINQILAGSGPAGEKSEAIRRIVRILPFPESLTEAIAAELEQLLTRKPELARLTVNWCPIPSDNLNDRFDRGAPQSIDVLETGEILAAYRDAVLRGLAPERLENRENPVSLESFQLAVSVTETVLPEVFGTIQTVDPASEDRDLMLVESVEKGEVMSDRFRLHRQDRFRLVQSELHPRRNPDTRAETAIVSERLMRGSAGLTPVQLFHLAENALLLEKTFYTPQLIEWGMTADETLILDSRPLQADSAQLISPEELAAELAVATVLLQDRGQVVQLGTRSGTVVQVSPAMDASEFPVGAIAVSHWATPELSPIVKKAAAIVTDIGSPIGHLATIAREYNTPALFGTGVATQLLANGQVVTIDIENRTVYAGVVKTLIRDRNMDREILVQSDELKKLRRMLRWITPLRLTDPDAREFSPEGCESLHDIIRFCHEKSVSTIANLNIRFKKRFKLSRYRLSEKIPFQIKIIDLGGGISGKPGREIKKDQILSMPFQAIFKGLSNQQAWNPGPISFGFKDLMSSFSRPVNWLMEPPEYQGENLALVAADYCNLSLRLGYHFNVIDSYLSRHSDNNYVYFRFIGGFADAVKRQRRVEFINLVLTGLRFKTNRKGDLIVGKIKMLSLDEMLSILQRLGELVTFSRQLDVQMKDEDQVDSLFSEFLDKCRPDRIGELL